MVSNDRGKSMKGTTSRKARRRQQKQTKRARSAINVPGPSSNPATNLLVADLAIRSVSILMRRGFERGLLRNRFPAGKAADIVAGRSLGQSLIAYAATRIATRSVPGMLLVGGGILAKLAFERSKTKRHALRSGDQDLHAMADNAPDA